MYKKLRLVKFIILTFISFSVYPQSLTDKFDLITVEDGLSQSVVNCIYQDTQGFIWFGTQHGLNRYDGYNFTVFLSSDTIQNPISGDNIQCIYEDTQGNLWIGTENNGLNFFDIEKQQFKVYIGNYDESNSLIGNSVYSVLEDNQGVLWIGTNTGLSILDKETEKFKKVKFTNSDNAEQIMVRDLFEDKQNYLWIGSDNGLYRMSKNRKRVKTFKNEPENTESISNNEIQCITQSYDNELLVGTNQGLNCYSPKKENFRRVYFESGDLTDMMKNEIYDIALDKRESVWIGTFGGGLVQWNKKTGATNYYTNSPNAAKSLSSNTIMSLLVDRSGMLWIGTYGDEGRGGINKLNLVQTTFDKIVQNKTNSNTLISNEIYAIIEDHRGNLWFGTESGLSIYYQQEKIYKNFVSTDNQGDLSNSTIYSILQDADKNIWIGTLGGGVNKLELSDYISGNFKFRHFQHDENDPNTIIGNDIFSLLDDKDGNIWVGTTNGLSLMTQKGEILETFINDPANPTSLSDNEVQCIFQDSEGTIWIGTYNGLNQYFPRNKLFRCYYHQHQEPNSLSNNVIYSINEGSDKELWIGTDAGLCRINYERNEFRTFTINDGLPDNVIYGILKDDEQNLWLSTNKGLSKMKVQERIQDYMFINYNSQNWLHCDAFNIGAYYKANDGKLLFGCNEGVTIFDPENIKGNTYIPPIVITDFQLFFEKVAISDDGTTPLSKHITQTDKIVLKPKQNRLLFEFAALNYIVPEKNEYAFKMEGLDDDWIFCRNERKANYTNLSPGEYVFRVKGSNNDGIWNETGTAIEIEVTTPIYLRFWFIFSEIIVGIAIVILIFRMRTLRLRKNQKELEQKVKERTMEVMQQKEELEATLENLRTTQSQLIDSEKMASLGQLTAGVAHEINNPINFISGNINPLKRDIQDIIEILSEYDNTVDQLKLKEKFRHLQDLKEDLEYDFLLNEIKELLNGIEEGVRRTTDIVRGLRNFSRLDEDDMKLANVNEGIDSTLLILKNKLKNRITIKKELGEVPEIICYPGKINQVFMNILNNASDAIKGEGEIEIKTWQKKSGNKDFVNISIKDSGIGMDETTRKRIFEPFFTTKDVGQGTGLGLSITFGIIENHKGKIDVESKPGEGTKFIITIPVHQEK